MLVAASTEDLLRISTLSGIVEAKVLPGATLASCEILVSQPKGTVEGLSQSYIPNILSSLGLTEEDLAPGYPVQNGCTSRTKTLIPLKNRDVLQNITPDSESIRRVCEQIESTGLYPYIILDSTTQLIEARQFPRSVGYVEDPATGIAAAALWFGLVENGIVDPDSEKPVRMRQGWAMGKPSEISVCLRRGGYGVGCWITGKVKWRS
jgi:PhzF family phenazine biosynthesis protein